MGLQQLEDLTALMEDIQQDIDTETPEIRSLMSELRMETAQAAIRSGLAQRAGAEPITLMLTAPEPDRKALEAPAERLQAYRRASADAASRARGQDRALQGWEELERSLL